LARYLAEWGIPSSVATPVFKEAQALAASFRAELESLLAIFKQRKHVENLEKTIMYLTGLKGQPGPDDFYDTGGEGVEAYPVFHANCGKIGLLGDAAESVVSAYTRLKAVDSDLVFIRERHQRLSLSLTKIVTAHENVKALMVDAIKRAEVAVVALRHVEDRRFYLLGKRVSRRAGRATSRAS